MKEHPILFSAPMVCAILAGEKTQTRRIIDRDAAHKTGLVTVGGSLFDTRRHAAILLERCPYGGAGDQLWVRETWRTEERASDLVDGIRFRADQAFVPIQNTKSAAGLWVEAHENGEHGATWRPSIFLRRWASRLSLEISAVRVERLQNITDDDIRAEGVTLEVAHELAPKAQITTLREAWAAGWDAINGKRVSWASNPWVWVLHFVRAGA